MWSYNLGVENFGIISGLKSRGSRNKKDRKCCFWFFLDPYEPLANSNHHQNKQGGGITLCRSSKKCQISF